MNSPTLIDDLPLEMISELFKYLHLKHLAACALVNKRWHSIYAGVRVQSVVAVGEKDYELTRWGHPDRPIEEKERCHLKWFSRLLEKPLFSNLKRLALCDHFSSFDLNQLNRFSQLEQLEINFEILTRKVNLSLPKLKVLAIHLFNEYCSLEVDCPELNVLVYRGESEEKSLLNVKNPETILKLDTDIFGRKLSPFKNVDSLITRKFKAICKTTILSLPSLNELHYNTSFREAFWDNANQIAKRTLLMEFLADVKALKGPEFRFRFAGFPLASCKKLDEINFGLQAIEGDKKAIFNEYVYMKNYQFIDGTLDFVSHVDYPRLMENVTGEIPVGFFNKFTGIVNVFASGAVRDESHFLWFLRSLASLRTLELENLVLSQRFYDRLPASANSLRSFTLRRDHELQLNFDFICKFSSLSELFIHPIFSFESGGSLVRLLGKLEKCVLDFRLKGKRLFIEKFKDANVFAVYEDRQNIIEIEKAEEIVNFFERLQNDMVSPNENV